MNLALKKQGNEAFIQTDPEKVMNFLDDVIDATDNNRNSFGFIKRGGYEEAVQRGRLWVATNSKDEYLGHILLGGKIPQDIRIFQVYVSAESRGLGIAHRLVEEATKYAESLSCLYLRADVAIDLTDAIKFWQSQGFCALQARKKQTTTGRDVFIFQKRLATPSLLPSEDLPLNIVGKSSALYPDSYVIDLNIFLSLTKNEANSGQVAGIIKSAMAGEFSLFVTPEFEEELQRSKRPVDPIFELAQNTLPSLPRMAHNDLETLQEEIRDIVFPTRSKSRKNAQQDDSDIRHLAYCVQNSKAGFVTEEKAILNAKGKLRAKYDLNIFSLQDFNVEKFGSTDQSLVYAPIESGVNSFLIENAKSIGQFTAFIKGLGSKFDDACRKAEKTVPRGVTERKIIQVSDGICSIYFSQTRGTKHDILEGIYLAQDGYFDGRELIFQHMLEHFIRHAQLVGAKEISFFIRDDDLNSEKICLDRGFQRVKDTGINGLILLKKIAAPLLVTPANWKDFRSILSAYTKVEFPHIIPSLKSGKAPSISVSKDGRAYEASLFDIETLLSPSLLMLPKRGGVIIPIHSSYGEELLSRRDDALPFPVSQEALLRLVKAYYRKPSHSDWFLAGTPVVFYESKSGRDIIGCARIIQAETTTPENAYKKYKNFGVLDEAALQGQINSAGNVQVITFDNFKVFPKPVSLKKLKELGGAKANMVGPEKLSHSQLFHIMHEGLGIHSRDVLLSIQPEHVERILSGKKTIELRKKPFPVNGGVNVWIYSTSPSSSVVATAFIQTVDSGTPEEIWNQYSKKCCVTKDEFDAYFSGSSEAYALTLQKVERLDRKIKLEEIKKIEDGFVPPQYYRYVKHDSSLFLNLLERKG